MSELAFFLFLMAGLLFLSAFFSSSETALFSLTPEMVRRSASNSRLRRIISVLQDHPTELLSSILFGNLIVNILFFCTGAAAAGRWGAEQGDWFEALGGILILFSVILFGEIIPKAVGVNYSVRLLHFVANPLHKWFRLTYQILRPLHFMKGRQSVEDSLTAEELKELLRTVQNEPGFGSHEKAILEDIVMLSDIRVREVLVPRIEVLRKPVEITVEEVLAEVRSAGHRYVILYEGKEDNLFGYIKASEVFFCDKESMVLKDLVRPLVFVPETRRIEDLLHDFLAEGWELVAVVDEYGGFSGVVTLQDLFEEVVGDMEEEKRDEIVQIDEITYRLSGRLSVRDWQELFAGSLRGQRHDTMAFDTLGGLVVALLGRMPCPGDTVTLRNLRFTVETVRSHRVETVLLHLNLPEDRS